MVYRTSPGKSFKNRDIIRGTKIDINFRKYILVSTHNNTRFIYIEKNDIIRPLGK